ncbi:MAG: hypothetical protein WC763_05120 [Candidatus Paceibacterota bacterium]|jgi:hypothetical protein
MLDRVALLESLNLLIRSMYGTKHDEFSIRLYEDFRCHTVGWAEKSLLEAFQEYTQSIIKEYAKRETAE